LGAQLSFAGVGSTESSMILFCKTRIFMTREKNSMLLHLRISVNHSTYERG